MTTRQTLHFFVCLFFVAFAFPAYAQLKVDVTRGVTEPIPVAIPEFYTTAPAAQQVARGIPDVISNNLKLTGLFKPLPSSSFIQDVPSLATQGPRFGEWKAINAQALISGLVTQNPDGRLRVEFRLFDVLSQQQLTGMAYMTTPTNWRRIAHIISDEIYKRLTGETGYFDSRVVYISETGPAEKRIKRLSIMDQDGFNNRNLTDGSTIVLTPRFSPNAPLITYMAYYGGKPRVYLYNIDSGRQEVLGDFPGMSFAPRFSPDGSRVVMSLSQSGNTDIYSMDLRSRRPQQLTNSSAIETAPSFAPDGRRITFESDRSGTQQIYVMNSDGSGQQRISFGQGRYAGPVWSPRGDLIAFTRIYKGQFYIGIIKPDGSGERMITSGVHVEGPTWSPNGRVLMFFKDPPGGQGASMYAIDVTGYNERRMSTPSGASDPAWGPLNK